MWDQRYSEAGFAYGEAPNDYLKSVHKHIPKDGKVLCLAEGEGRNAVFLAQHGYHVTAVDISPVGLKKAQHLANTHNVHIDTLVGDLASYDLGVNKWDGIVAIFMHLPPDVRKKIHRQIPNALVKHGVFIAEAYTHKQLNSSGVGGPPASFPELFVSQELIVNELKYMHFEHIQEKCRTLNEGKYHQGQSEVVQCLAIKR